MKSLRNILLSLVLVGVTALSTNGYSAESDSYSNSQTNWATDYQAALKQSKENSLPIVLFFTGSDWCSWCKKLEAEAFDTPEFVKATAGKFIFVKLDFPMNKKLDPQTTEQNKQLSDKYHIKGYPTVVVIDSNEKTLGNTGYVAGGGKKYADHLQSLVTRK